MSGFPAPTRRRTSRSIHRAVGANPLASAMERRALIRISVPDIIEFVCSDRYLNRPLLFPRQATLLKAMFLQEELFTDYDLDVLEKWSGGFSIDEERIRDDPHYIGNNGIAPDILDRIRICRSEGRPWFRESTMVIGRRGSKGHIGGLSGAYVLWNYLAMLDPQGHFNIDRDKRLSALVFAGKREQAKANQWRDVRNVILGGPCFGPYISRDQAESLTVYAPIDRSRMWDLIDRGIETDSDPATFEILAKESTVQAGRGPAAFMQFYDEMAHVVNTGANRSAEEVYDAATPALDQFGVYGFIYSASSPWQQTGQFHINYQESLEVDPVTRDPIHPERLMVQLTSWDPYLDFDRTKRGDFEVRPVYIREGRKKPTIYFLPLKSAIQTYDAQMQRLERAKPETFKVERRAHFATVLDAYLNPKRVEEMFGPWNGEFLVMKDRGLLSVTYKAHGDPGVSGARFGVAIAHAEQGEDGLIHAVFDHITAYDPQDEAWSLRDEDDNPEWEIDYTLVEPDLFRLFKGFMPDEATFDQWNSHQLITRLTKSLRAAKLPKRILVYEKTANHKLNWARAETFKTAIGMGLVHCPYFEILELESKFLQDKGGKVEPPTSGPVQTKDVWDCVAECTYYLLGEQMAGIDEDLARLMPEGSLPGGIRPRGLAESQDQGDVHQALSGFGHSVGRSRSVRGPMGRR